MLCGYEHLRLKYTPAMLPAIVTINTHVTPQSWVVSWYDFQLISPSQLCLVDYMRETNRHPLQKCVRSSAVSRNVIITSKSLPVCANSKRRQADIPWALARTTAHISGEARNGVSSPGRLRAVSVKPCPRCRRKVRLRRIRRQSHFSATVWTGLYMHIP